MSEIDDADVEAITKILQRWPVPSSISQRRARLKNFCRKLADRCEYQLPSLVANNPNLLLHKLPWGELASENTELFDHLSKFFFAHALSHLEDPGKRGWSLFVHPDVKGHADVVLVKRNRTLMIECQIVKPQADSPETYHIKRQGGKELNCCHGYFCVLWKPGVDSLASFDDMLTKIRIICFIPTSTVLAPARKLASTSFVINVLGNKVIVPGVRGSRIYNQPGLQVLDEENKWKRQDRWQAFADSVMQWADDEINESDESF